MGTVNRLPDGFLGLENSGGHIWRESKRGTRTRKNRRRIRVRIGTRMRRKENKHRSGPPWSTVV